MNELSVNLGVAGLLEPCAGDAPTGIDLREDFSAQSPYTKLRDARSEARAAERAADSDPNAPATMPPQWRVIRELALKVLQEKTKDLEVASWLTESLVRSDGLDGLTAGAALIAGLLDRFWDETLYPMPDEDGMITRVAPLTGLNGEGGDGTLIQPLQKLPFCRTPDGETLLYYQYAEAARLETLAPAVRQARHDAGAVKFDTVAGWARAAGQPHFLAQRKRVDAAIAAWQALAEMVDARAGADAPPTTRVRDLLTDIRDAYVKYGPAVSGEMEASGVDASPDEAPVAGAARDGGASPAGRAASRDDMLRDLTRISEWFKRAEPNSPLAYTLEEAIRRGRMTWPEMLTELVSDTGTRNTILMGLGIKPPPDEYNG